MTIELADDVIILIVRLVQLGSINNELLADALFYDPDKLDLAIIQLRRAYNSARKKGYA